MEGLNSNANSQGITASRGAFHPFMGSLFAVVEVIQMPPLPHYVMCNLHVNGESQLSACTEGRGVLSRK